eukprot:11352621-Alexandrium_andersonii.AAC.1
MSPMTGAWRLPNITAHHLQRHLCPLSHSTNPNENSVFRPRPLVGIRTHCSGSGARGGPDPEQGIRCKA